MVDVRAVQDSLMVTAIAAVKKTESALASVKDSKARIAALTQLTADQGKNVLEQWKDLLPQLITKYVCNSIMAKFCLLICVHLLDITMATALWIWTRQTSTCRRCSIPRAGWTPRATG
jgi:hypothetical protein